MRRLNQEHGALTVAFALLLVAVFLPLMLVVGDFGRIVVERRQLQNSADAAALAVAFDCARSVMDPSIHICSGSSAQTYANANDSHDGNTAVPVVQIDQTPPCLDTTTNAACVRVTTRSREGSNDSIGLWVSQFFDSNRARAQVTTTATAAWGGAATADVVPFIVPFARWKQLADAQKAQWPAETNAQGLFPSNGPFPADPRMAPVLYLVKAENPDGSFGGLTSGTSYCLLSASIFTPVTSTGNDFACKTTGSNNDPFQTIVANKSVHLATSPPPGACAPNLPCPATGKGSGAQYGVYAFMEMRVNGYYFNQTYRWPDQGSNKEWEIGQAHCTTLLPTAPPKPDDSQIYGCIRGWLTASQVGTGGVGGGQAGVQNVQLIK